MTDKGNEEIKRVTEDAEEGLHGRVDDPDTPPETGPIEAGPVDAGPTGLRDDGIRRPESGNRIVLIGGTALVVIVVVILVGVLL
ncbi:hypothetical protein [Bauldia sp.]|uniref:hypothetical protein n=1 Tax=Bauldia sp. TaxID=2575872 RepID=UPI003BA98E93